METFAIVAILTLLVVVNLVVGLFVLTAFVFMRKLLETYDVPTNTFTFPKNITGSDTYTPNYGDRTVPLESFEPDLSKPIKVKYKTEADGSETMEVE